MSSSPTNPSQKTILEPVTGVWEGTYTVVDPTGRLLERFDSRQEIRLEEDRWYERIIYRRPGKGPEVLDFIAHFNEREELVFDDERCSGRLHTVTPDTLLFIFRWKNDPDTVIHELLNLNPPDGKGRIWNRLERGKLHSITMIQEHRVPGAEPEIWA